MSGLGIAMTPAVALGLTLVIEVPLAIGLTQRDRRRRIAIDALLLNLLTHPLAVFGHRWLVRLGVGWWGAFALIEILVFAVEACGYRTVTRLSWRRALTVSAICNAVTAGLSPLFS